MIARVEDDRLVIELPLEEEPRPSKSSGKTLTIASSGGNQPFNLMIDGEMRKIFIGCFAFCYPEEFS